MSGRERRTWKASWICACGHLRSRRARASSRTRAAVLNDSALVQAVVSNV